MSVSIERTALLALVVLMPGTASGQAVKYGSVTFSTTQTYEDNLFATPASRGQETDVISRFGPALDAGFRSHSLALHGRYAVDAERYWRHAELNRGLARQDGAIELLAHPTRRLALKTNASYMKTQTPFDIDVESRLAHGRTPATRAIASAGATYEWNRNIRLTMDYEFVKEGLVDGVATVIHSPRIGLERRPGARTAYRADYRLQHAGPQGGPADASHVFTIGWTRELARRTDVEIDAGPRLSDGAIQPEVSAVVRRQGRRGEVSLGFSRTRTTAIAESGMIDLRSVVGRVTYTPARRVSMTVAPGLARSAREGRHASVRSLDLEATVLITRSLSLVTLSRLGKQYGTLHDSYDEIPYRSMHMTVRVVFPSDPLTRN